MVCKQHSFYFLIYQNGSWKKLMREPIRCCKLFRGFSRLHVYKTIKNDKDVKSKILIHMGLPWWLVIKNMPWASLVAQTVKNLPAVQDTRVWYLGQEDPIEKGMATDSIILTWETPLTEETGRLQSMWWQRLGHNWMTNTFTFLLEMLFLNFVPA